MRKIVVLSDLQPNSSLTIRGFWYSSPRNEIWHVSSGTPVSSTSVSSARFDGFR